MGTSVRYRSQTILGFEAFTIVEMLMVLGMIAILASLVLTGIQRVREQARKTKARHEVDQIVTTWNNYLQEYRHFPKSAAITRMDSTALQILRGDIVHADNPYRLTFIEFKTNVTSFVDPWGTTYYVELDNDLDNKITVPGAGQIYRSVAAWSAGPDKISGNTDDVRSWQR